MKVTFTSLDEFLAADPLRRGPHHDVATWQVGQWIDVRFIPSTKEAYALHRSTDEVELLGTIQSAELGSALILLPGWKAKDFDWVRRRIETAPTDPAEVEEAIVRARHAWEADAAIRDV